MASLLACPSCSSHAKPHEVNCPNCGAPLRRPDGSARRTTAALLLGLSAVALPATGASCSSEQPDDDNGTSQNSTTTESVTAYGVGGFPGVGGMGGEGGAGGSAGQSEGGAGGTGGAGGGP